MSKLELMISHKIIRNLFRESYEEVVAKNGDFNPQKFLDAIESRLKAENKGEEL